MQLMICESMLDALSFWTIKRCAVALNGLGTELQYKELYNDRCNKLPKARQLSEKRKKAIRAILKKYSLDEIIQVFDKANASDFLTGKNDRGWVADFDFIFREDKFLSILEGKYNGKKKSIDGLASAPRATKEDKNERVYHF